MSLLYLYKKLVTALPLQELVTALPLQETCHRFTSARTCHRFTSTKKLVAALPIQDTCHRFTSTRNLSPLYLYKKLVTALPLEENRGTRSLEKRVGPFPKRQILDSSKLIEFADDNFKFDENGGKFFKWVENNIVKEEIARYAQFFLSLHCFQKTCTADT